MPRPDKPHRRFSRSISAHVDLNPGKGRKGKKRKGDGGELAPAAPDRPKLLSGGAAAALEFDD